MLEKILRVVLSACVVAGLVACNNNQNKVEEKIKVGTISGPETELMETAKYVAKNKYNLDVEIVQFQDYATPNAALADGTLDANAFQTVQYLDAAKAAQGYDFVVVGKTFIYPMGLYSEKITTLAEFPQQAKVAIPNDPSNEERALLLLEKAGLLKLDHKSEFMTSRNIAENPLQLEVITLDAAQLPHALTDVTLAAINTNYAVAVDLVPTQDALVIEGKDSPYANVIAVRTEMANDPRILHLVAAYQSPEVAAKAEELFKGQAISVWENK